MTTRHALILCSLVTLLPVGAAAQASAPVWTKADQFWYRRTVPGGYVWLNVDARHGVKEPLFDHQRLAIELTIRTGVDYTPLTLPFAEPAAQFVVKYDGSNAYIQQGAMAIEFVHGGRSQKRLPAPAATTSEAENGICRRTATGKRSSRITTSPSSRWERPYPARRC